MKTFTLSIPKPCSEKWEDFTPTDTGGFCSSCNKVVIDFTKMTDEQVIDFIKQKPSHACGRFRHSQLKQYHQLDFAKVKPGYMFLKAGMLSALLLLANKPSSARDLVSDPPQTVQVSDSLRLAVEVSLATYYVRGVVLSAEDNLPIPGVVISVKGWNVPMVTDVDGRFEIKESLREGTVIVFAFIGYSTHEYVVGPANENQVEIVMTPDIHFLGEVIIAGGINARPTGIRGLWWKVRSWF